MSQEKGKDPTPRKPKKPSEPNIAFTVSGGRERRADGVSGR